MRSVILECSVVEVPNLVPNDRAIGDSPVAWTCSKRRIRQAAAALQAARRD